MEFILFVFGLVIIFVSPLFGVFVGMFCGWVVGLFDIGRDISDVLGQVGIHAPLWQVGLLSVLLVGFLELQLLRKSDRSKLQVASLKYI
jgi:hypothetical protein